MPLGVADSVIAPVNMILKPDTLLQRAASIVLVLYVGAFFGQVLCVLHTSNMESEMGVAVEGLAAHATPPMGTHGPSQHGDHPSTPGQSHSGACAVVACGSAVTATPDHGPESMTRASNSQVAYLDGTMPPETEMVPPPPRLV